MRSGSRGLMEAGMSLVEGEDTGSAHHGPGPVIAAEMDGSRRSVLFGADTVLRWRWETGMRSEPYTSRANTLPYELCTPSRTEGECSE